MPGGIGSQVHAMNGLLLSTVFLLQSGAMTIDDKPVKFPVEVVRTGFEAGIFDVGLGYVSGQPTADALRELAKEGVTTVVSTRTQEEMDDRKQVSFDEPALLKDLGVDYFNIPLGPDGTGAVKRFAAAVDGAKGKVLLHCTVAWRATYMWMAYLIQYRHFSVDDAWSAGMQMNVTVDRTALMLGREISYAAVPRKEGARKPKEGVVSKPGSKLKITSPKVIHAPTNDRNEFVLWDMGSIYNGGQANEKQFRELASRGVKTVVNLRTPAAMKNVKDAGFDEEAVAKELGMTYVSVPLQGWQSFTPENLALIAEAFEKSDGKVFIHDASGTASSQALVPYLVKYQDMNVDEATKVGEAMRWGWSQMLTDLIGMDLTYKLKPKSG